MPRLRFLDTLGVACALLCASHLVMVQNTYAVIGSRTRRLTTQETTHFPIDATSVKIPLVQADKGVDVHCSLDPSEVLSIGILKQNKVDIVCRYPDDQMLTARALTILDVFTGETLTHPAMLFFSNARKYNETLYRLYVDCP